MPLRMLAAALVLVSTAACGDATSEGGTEPETTDGPTPPVLTADDEVLVSCGGYDGWPPSVMADGAPGILDDAEARRAFQEILDDPRYAGEAELTLFADGVDVDYRVLRGDDKSVVLGIGEWTEDGPAERDTYYLVLERSGDRLVPGGWGSCSNLGPILRDGLAWARVGSFRGGSASTTLTISVSELDCTSARDPRPFLHAPVVIESDDAVVVYSTSTPMTEVASCPGNPAVDLGITLDRPLDDRPLLDGSFYPPRPVSISAK